MAGLAEEENRQGMSLPPQPPDRDQETERYRQMLDALSDLGEAMVVTEAGKMLYCNDAYERLTGYTFAELAARANLIELAPPELQADLTRRLADRLAGRVGVEHAAESQLVTRDGRRIDCEFSIRMLAGEGPNRILGLIRDITPRKQAERALRESEQRVRAVVDNVTDAIISFTQDGEVLTLNPAAERMFLCDHTHLPALQVNDLVAEGSRAQFSAALAEWVLGDAPSGPPREAVGRRQDGTIFTMEYALSPMDVEGGRLFLATMRDISDRKAHTEALEYQALHDSLTGLPNRTLFGDRLRQKVLRAQRRSATFPLLMFDLDRFKDINDSLGHEAGDLLLEALAARLAEVLRESDTVARLGGDEFAVLPDGMPGPADAITTAQKILKALEAPFEIEGERIVTSASIGISVYPDDGDDAASLVRRADVAMYAAKRSSSGYALYAADQDRHAAHRLSLLTELREAVSAGQLVLQYQPKVHLRSRTTVAVEALVRWQHPRDGMLSPDNFIPLAEQSELIRPLTRWVLEAALQQARAWWAAGSRIQVAVNLSTRNLHDSELPAYLADLLRANGLPAEVLTLEITESAAMDPEAADRLLPISNLGVNLSIDDFGTGYSSLAYLKRLPVSELKIDRSFVMALDTDADDAAIVIPTIDLGHNLGLSVVAEGVENEASELMLLRHGCDFAQGYHVSRPMIAGALQGWLESGEWPLAPLT
ncbi:MAG: hypothetical protein QOK05_205 [Chloroflexota bacterium]|jgi:diguanylate cyclase (GGDEF)-like protein/PAS domain S-box-containing protein|nr:hypothetical protein [Chloroflexota bacterium]